MKPFTRPPTAVLILALLAVTVVVAACADLGGETTTTQASITSTTWPEATTVIDEGADGTSVHLQVGDTLVLRLQGNPTTGYMWKFTSAVDPILVRQGDFTYTADSDLVGAGGVYQAAYLAVDDGVTSLALDYVGPDERVDHNYYVDIVVGEGAIETTTTAVAETTTSVTTADAGAVDDGAVADDGAVDDGAADDGAPADDGADDGTDDSSSPPASALFRLDQGDDGETIVARVGDRIEVVVPLHPVAALTAKLKKPDTGVFDVVDVFSSGGSYTVRLRVIGGPDGKIMIEYHYPDDTIHPNKWSVAVKVE